uniref:Uncharacterized protein n=1 Tax=Panagrellus redivivus TaxID=6233 RepID=A0A7E4VM03_PANRE
MSDQSEFPQPFRIQKKTWLNNGCLIVAIGAVEVKVLCDPEALCKLAGSCCTLPVAIVDDVNVLVVCSRRCGDWQDSSTLAFVISARV